MSEAAGRMAANTQTVSSGWWSGKVHHFPTRVYYADTDAAGVVYHGKYLDFAERARTEMMRLIDLGEIYAGGLQEFLFVVRACEIDFLKSARLDDLVEVRTRFLELGGASFKLSQEIWRDSAQLTNLGVTLVSVKGGKPCRIPEALRARMSGFLG